MTTSAAVKLRPTPPALSEIKKTGTSPAWNVAAQDQATDRAHRIGQQHTVTVYKLIAKDTIEERIMQMQESKRDLVNSVLGGDGISSALFTREDVLALLGGDGR